MTYSTFLSILIILCELLLTIALTWAFIHVMIWFDKEGSDK